MSDNATETPEASENTPVATDLESSSSNSNEDQSDSPNVLLQPSSLPPAKGVQVHASEADLNLGEEDESERLVTSSSESVAAVPNPIAILSNLPSTPRPVAEVRGGQIVEPIAQAVAAALAAPLPAPIRPVDEELAALAISANRYRPRISLECDFEIIRSLALIIQLIWRATTDRPLEIFGHRCRWRVYSPQCDDFPDSRICLDIQTLRNIIVSVSQCFAILEYLARCIPLMEGDNNPETGESCPFCRRIVFDHAMTCYSTARIQGTATQSDVDGLRFY